MTDVPTDVVQVLPLQPAAMTGELVPRVMLMRRERVPPRDMVLRRRPVRRVFARFPLPGDVPPRRVLADVAALSGRIPASGMLAGTPVTGYAPPRAELAATAPAMREVAS